MRLLDIDKVIEALQEPYNNGTYRGVDYDQTDAAAFEEALEAAYKEYGIEAEPVRRGKWVKRGGLWICSECGAQDYYAYVWNSESGEDTMQDLYCPNCGAYMETER